MSRSWYIFMGDDDPYNVLQYERVTVKHSFLCGNRIGVISSNDDEKHPKSPLSPNLRTYINKALITGQLQPDTPFGSKKFVYLKDF